MVFFRGMVPMVTILASQTELISRTMPTIGHAQVRIAGDAAVTFVATGARCRALIDAADFTGIDAAVAVLLTQVVAPARAGGLAVARASAGARDVVGLADTAARTARQVVFGRRTGGQHERGTEEE